MLKNPSPLIRSGKELEKATCQIEKLATGAIPYFARLLDSNLND